jgi:thiol-disulfide isomerase/thioredoxin
MPVLVGILAAWGLIEITGGRIRAPDRLRALRRWLMWAVIGGLAAGRAVHVIANWEGFAGEPLTALAFWQGGLSGKAAMVAVLVITAVALGRHKANFAPTVWAVMAGLAVGWGTALVGGAGGGLPDLAHRYQTLDGEGFDLASEFAAGRPVVLNLWATWCGPCRRELPLFQEVLQSHDDITFAFASQREPAQRVALYLATEGLRLPNVIFDTEGLLGRRYAGFGLPTTLFIAPNGKVQALHVGEISRARLEAEIARLKAAR